MEGLRSQVSLSFTELKETFLKFLELLLIWVSRRTMCVQHVRSNQVPHSLMVCRPNSVGIFTNAELLPTLLKYVISKVKRTKLFLTVIRSLRAIQVFNVCNTHTNLIASVDVVNVFLGHHLTYEDNFLV